MLVLLPQDEEGGVEELRKLGEEVPPGGVGHAQGLGVQGPVHRLTEEGVVKGPAGGKDLVQDPGGKDNLKEEDGKENFRIAVLIVFVEVEVAFDAVAVVAAAY